MRNDLLKYMRNCKGFTLPEILTSAVIMSFIFMAIVSFYVLAQTVWVEGNINAEMQRDARAAMEKMVRGENGHYGIRSGIAGTFNLISTDSLEVDVDKNSPKTPEEAADDTTIKIYRSANQIIFDPDTSTGGDEKIISENVRTLPTGLIFEIPVGSNSLVKITVITQDEIRGKTINAELFSQVRLRN